MRTTQKIPVLETVARNRAVTRTWVGESIRRDLPRDIAGQPDWLSRDPPLQPQGNVMHRTTLVSNPNLAAGITALVLCMLSARPTRAHPGSGIVVDSQGRVYFVETGNPDVRFPGFIWEIDPQGRLTPIHRIGAHWLTLDANGSFAKADVDAWFRERRTPWLDRVEAHASGSILVQADGCPIVINRDGNLYYASGESPEQAGGLQISRLTPQGKVTRLVPDLGETSKRLGGIKGLASGPDGSLYVAYPKAIQKVTMDGMVTTVADPVVPSDCDKDVPAGETEPFLRGLAVDSRGVVYAAATGCRCVAKVTPEGRVSSVMKSERPWSPTGVAVRGEDVYVLEYTNPNSADRSDWHPRVRKLGQDGRVTILAIAPRDR
jgi:sugar lactone lactonase YvrE